MEQLQAARRVPRPEALLPCPSCGEATGRNYGQCPACTDAVDRIWRADWEALLAAERIAPGSEDEKLLAQVVYAEYDRHPWTVVDWAMSLLRCPVCGCELGGGPANCPECQFAFGYTMASEFAAGQLGLVTRNEHALHIGRWVLRYPHRQSEKTLTGWRYSMPIILTGAEMPPAKLVQAAQPLILAGREDELDRLWDRRRNGGAVRWFPTK